MGSLHKARLEFLSQLGLSFIYTRQLGFFCTKKNISLNELLYLMFSCFPLAVLGSELDLGILHNNSKRVSYIRWNS